MDSRFKLPSLVAIAFSGLLLVSCSNSEEEPTDEAAVLDEPAAAAAEEGAPVAGEAEPPPAAEPAPEPEVDPVPGPAEDLAVEPAVDPDNLVEPGVLAPQEPDALAAEDQLENIIYLELACGRVVIETLPDLTPLHVERVKTLAREGFYDGLTFHRVIDGFMAQTGDPLGNGSGGSDLPDLAAEFNTESFVRGAVGMARTDNPDSANSQFFILFDAAPWLDGQYTLWGNVTAGMDCVDQIKRGEPVVDPDVILAMRVAADVQ